MNRDLVLAACILAVCGSAVWLVGWLPHRESGRPGESGRSGERRAWLSLWRPLLPAAVGLMALAGWALQEPRLSDEILHPLAPLFVAPLACVWIRAAVRAVRALVRPHRLPLAATVGILRPRIFVDPVLSGDLDSAALAATMGHERAHARHRDPLRIWLAQVVADLQWPSPHARARFEQWRQVLELARDEEAREGGAAGEDLAAALVGAARLGQRRVPAPIAPLIDGERALILRVQRLLDPLRAPAIRSWRAYLALAGAIALLGAAALFGFTDGDLLVRSLPIIGR
jgi:hypothetical protein